MRSSNKSRSRNKNSNRRPNNSMGNVVNRVFDSAGPDGRVRGTPQQIIEKYRTLAHDATLADDRVGAESFHQHAEHYARLLVTAQAEAAERQAEQQRRQQNAPRPNNGNDQPTHGGNDQPHTGNNEQPDNASFGQQNNSQPNTDDQPNTADIVDTPENQPKAEKPKPKPRKPAKPKPEFVAVEPDAQ